MKPSVLTWAHLHATRLPPVRHLSPALQARSPASQPPKRPRSRPNTHRRSSPLSSRPMKVAVVGCAHGELDAIYAAVKEAEQAQHARVDLVICAGDFQAVRNTADLACLACPPKYRHLNTFWRYYRGDAVAPVPTIFVGGNHEASNHLQEIPLGGLVAPNMYFLGNAGVVSYRGLRIAGLSGVYTSHNFHKSRIERPPYPRSQVKSVYHVRKEDVDRLMRIHAPVDVFITHDWPRGIWNHGKLTELLAAKPFLRSEIEDNSFGNPAATELLNHIQPSFWFSAHMHVKFPALVKHPESNNHTRFLALDKALPRRDFIHILDIPVHASRQDSMQSFTDQVPNVIGVEEEAIPIVLDPEWLAILQTEGQQPGRHTAVTREEMQQAATALRTEKVQPFVLPVLDFEKTAQVHDPKRPQLPAPINVTLQDRTIKLMHALNLSQQSWLAPVPQSAEYAAVAASLGVQVPSFSSEQ